MKISLSETARIALEDRHKRERDGRVRDRIKAVLLSSEGWSQVSIAQALRIHEETVRSHLESYVSAQKLKPENGGSQSKLTDSQTAEIKAHLSDQIYTRAELIIAYIAERYGVRYSLSGITDWLHAQGFSYKAPKLIPCKADVEKQKAFIDSYEALKKEASESEPIVFIDSAHPTMSSKVSYGWIKTGEAVGIKSNASRTRLNVTGSIELSTMTVVSEHPEKVNAETTIEFFKKLQASYPLASKIHVILDRSGYHRSEAVRTFASKTNIELHYLPPYSPNLNPIERLWKVMNEKARNNRYFQSPKEFRESIKKFFDKTVHLIAESLRSRINDNFQIIYPVS